MPRRKFNSVPIPRDDDGELQPVMPGCEVCHNAAEMVIIHLRDGNTEWSCYECHAVGMASLLTDLAMAEARA